VHKFLCTKRPNKTTNYRRRAELVGSQQLSRLQIGYQNRAGGMVCAHNLGANPPPDLSPPPNSAGNRAADSLRPTHAARPIASAMASICRSISANCVPPTVGQVAKPAAGCQPATRPFNQTRTAPATARRTASAPRTFHTAFTPRGPWPRRWLASVASSPRTAAV